MNTIRIQKKQTQLIAHRGLSGLEAENTLCAFVAAGNRSYFGVETDVHVTADGQFILIHDNSTERVAGEEQIYAVEQTDFATLRGVTLLDRDQKAGRVDLRLPSLDEYIDCCKKYEKICVLEFKNRMKKADIGRIAEHFRAAEYLDRVIFISFCLENLIDLREICPNHPVQYLVRELREDVFEVANANRMDIDTDWKSVTKEWVDRLHRAGLKLNAYTINDPEVAERFADWGMDYITTNILE